MNGKELFKKHYSRLVIEGIIKSALLGLAIGFGANFVAAFFAWMFDFGGIWFGIGVGAGVAAVSGVILYFLKFKPNMQDVARRLDRLGLQERMVTMLELKGDDSYIAEIQRENARAHLAKVSHRNIRFRISKVIVVVLAVAFIFASSMTTVVGLAESGIIPPGDEIITPDDPYENHIAISYMAEEGGEIEGETDQLVAPGESTTPVVAVAHEGWVFVGWEDGVETPERSEDNVLTEMIYFAIFEEIGEGEGGDGSEGGNPGESGDSEGDSAEDVPEGGSANVESDTTGDAGDEGDGQGGSSDSDGGEGSSEEEGEGKGDGKGQGAGGKWEDSNQFLDGKTYYKDHIDMYYQLAQEILAEGGEIPQELREFLEAYYDSI